ncbi:hypothetical protein DFQ27_005640 [Actinomortierella ambigua]|uniref:Uncharacterized protein n=1 Tax=Actinomortierella ambigua TaxID=1343610 RepID=A0A9P6PYK4_9FUNG|nr:hypothetical protein DFQ27_005640 [Actinomortierella ambigua]
MLVIVAVEAQSSPDGLCQAWAESVQSKSNLPEKPDESGFKQSISGEIARMMFPDNEEVLDEEGSYSFRATFDNCTPSPAISLGNARSGPFKEDEYDFEAASLSALVGFDPYLANVFESLPYDPKKSLLKNFTVSGSDGWVTMRGVEIEDGDFTQECVVAPGWKCTAVLRVKDRSSRKTVIRKKFRKPTFFPAAQNQQPLFKNIWMTVRG